MIKNFNELSKRDLGNKVDFKGRVEVVKQTSGPTLMIINDGTKSFTFKAFVKPGVLAYPNIVERDFVKGRAQIYLRNDQIEGEIEDLRKIVDEVEISEIRRKYEDSLNDKLTPKVADFTIESRAFEDLRDDFINVAKIIRKAVFESRPIILRHNADCDGYVSALPIERAVVDLIKEVSPGSNLEFTNYKRAPSKAPFYEYEDALKDSFWLLRQFKEKKVRPLVIVTDNGSTNEDILAYRHMKIYDAQIVVIDHHTPGEIVDGRVEVDEFLDGHLNPYLKGYDSNVCAGMLGFEIARFINPEFKGSFLLPAVAGIADHTSGPELDEYVKKAKQEGFDDEFLEDLGEILDMQIHFIKFMEAREYVEELFFNLQTQKKIVKMLKPELESRYKRFEFVFEKFAEVVDYGDIAFVKFDGESNIQRGEWPAIGKSTNYLHRFFEKKLKKPVVTGTYGSFFLTVRASDEVDGFKWNDFVLDMEKNFKYLNASGGGHERAGSLKFVESGRDEILRKFESFVSSYSVKK